MSATVTAKLNLDASGFTAALTRAQASLGRLKAVGVPALASGFAAASAAAAGLAVGIKKAVDIGGALSDLSTRTGVAAGELRVLQEAFSRNGLEAGQVGPVINKLQKAIIEAADGTGPAAQAFARMGLSLAEIGSLSSAGQLQAIGKAIAQLPDPAARAATAMQLFGRSGGELLTLFANSGALEGAARAIGDQADILTRNANIFDEASDILNSVGGKLEGLFIGIADQVVPAIMPLLDRIDAIDLSGVGQSLGDGLVDAIAMITSDNIGTLLALQFSIAARDLVNNLTRGFVGLGVLAYAQLRYAGDALVTALSFVTKMDFWKGIGLALMQAGYKFEELMNRAAATLLDAVSLIPGSGVFGTKESAAAFRSNAANLQTVGAQLSAASGAALTSAFSGIGEGLSDIVAKSVQWSADAMQGVGNVFDTSELKKTRDDFFASLRAGTDQQMAATRNKYGATKTQFGNLPALDEMSGSRSNTGIIAQSLQKVGGGGSFARFSDAANPAAQAVREQQKTNRVLEKYLPLLDRFAPQPTLMPS